jgi:hypothetical protein
MNLKHPFRGYISVWRLVVLLALGLLFFCACYAQTAGSNSSNSQTQSSPPDKSGAQDKKEEPGMTKLRIRVLTKDDKPVDNASVYVRYNESGGFLHHDKLAELSFKTNEDGSVKTPAVPQGKILIQVIAKGWHTFGKWYDVNTDEQTIQIKLEPPPHWY